MVNDMAIIAMKKYLCLQDEILADGDFECSRGSKDGLTADSDTLGKGQRLAGCARLLPQGATVNVT